MSEIPRPSPVRQMADAGWSERDLLLAMTQMLRNLCAWTVVSGRVPAASMRDMVEISALQLEEEGISPAAIVALRTVFEGATNGDWERLHRLVGRSGSRAKAASKRAAARAPRTLDA